MFFKIYNLVSIFLRKEEVKKPNSKVTPIYDYDYARMYELV